MSGLIWLTSVITWLVIGLMAAPRAAAMSYRYSQRSVLNYKGNAQYGRGAACVWFCLAIPAGPLAWVPLIADRTVSTTVPGIVDAERREQEQRIADLQRDIERLHREIGVRKP